MQLTEQELRDKADIVFTDLVPGAIDAAIFNDFFSSDVSDSLIPKDASGTFFCCLIGNWTEDFSVLNHSVTIFQLTDLSVSVTHSLGFENLIILIFDEENNPRDDSFFYFTPTNINTVELSFYRVPNYGKFFKVIIQSV